MRHLATLMFVVAALCFSTHALEDVTPQKCAILKDFVLPGPEAMLWRKIPWRPAFWEAVEEGQTADKPILLWAMNGHPLACV